MDNGGFVEDLESRTGEGKGTSSQDTLPEIDSKEAKQEKRRIYKNLFVISSAFLLLFTAFSTTSSLQSSINEVDGHRIFKRIFWLTLLYRSAENENSLHLTRGSMRWKIL